MIGVSLSPHFQSAGVFRSRVSYRKHIVGQQSKACHIILHFMSGPTQPLVKCPIVSVASTHKKVEWTIGISVDPRSGTSSQSPLQMNVWHQKDSVEILKLATQLTGPISHLREELQGFTSVCVARANAQLFGVWAKRDKEAAKQDVEKDKIKCPWQLLIKIHMYF
ncbi:unnamed protein product [Nyctereutes procyonoides]|uniref:(raccoon dog) hypothetical protein n=1 Tax=Nyctereutes procyonoides TaxID=34880 RepID=A0A811ZS12_NYCPR|nr:unnamed protein product [Nyctereutes procyonoides]